MQSISSETSVPVGCFKANSNVNLTTKNSIIAVTNGARSLFLVSGTLLLRSKKEARHRFLVSGILLTV